MQDLLRFSDLPDYAFPRLRTLLENVKFSGTELPMHIGEPKKVMEIHKRALDSGIYSQPIRYPTVPVNKDLIRINITSDHSKKQIQSLIEFLKNIR